MTERSYLFTLREAARRCPDILMSKLLRDAADDLAEMLDLLHLMPTIARIQDVNSSWALAHRLLSFAESGNDEPPAPRGGVLSVPVEDVMGC